MEIALVIVLGVLLIIGFSLFAKRLGLAAPVVLVIGGVVISYLPGVPQIELQHDIILLGVLPPILYAAAITVPVIDFRRNVGTIASLSVLLVIVSAFGSGFVLFMLLPNLDLAAAVALGAVISPPDAVAATAIGKRLGLPPRLVTVLEGEGLLNDATALVLLRSAIAVSAGGISTALAGVADFAYAVSVSVAIGLVVGAAAVWARSRIQDALVDNAISLLVPFLAFIPAEELRASGVVAVVVAGLYVGHNAPRFVGAQSRIAERVNWRSVQFILEHGVFLLMGVQIRALVQDIDPSELSASAAVGIGLLATLTLIVIRFLWVNPMVFILHRRAQRSEQRLLQMRLGLGELRRTPPTDDRARRRRDRAERLYQRLRADLEHVRRDGLDWRGGLVLSWSGMRGVVTLAAAQSLPEATPYRAQLILVAFTVAIVTLVAQGGTLPWLIRMLKIQGSDAHWENRKLAELLAELSTEGLQVLDRPHEALGDDAQVDPKVVERVRRDSTLRVDAAWERVRKKADGSTPHRQYRQLRRAVVLAEYEALLRARRDGLYPSRVLSRAQAMLELEETRLDTH
jgi:NhaP-type Na+/H+ or K+/H+ antiporter